MLCGLQDDIYGEDIYGGVSELGKSDVAMPISNGSLDKVLCISTAHLTNAIHEPHSKFQLQVGVKAEHSSDLARLATDRCRFACIL